MTGPIRVFNQTHRRLTTVNIPVDDLLPKPIPKWTKQDGHGATELLLHKWLFR